MLTTLLCTNVHGTNQIMLFTGNANIELAQKVAEYLEIPLGSALVKEFNDGEIRIHVQESVRGQDVYIVQPTCQNDSQSVNDNLMELFLLVRTMKRASAASITAVIPYYGYARQDRKTTSRVPISAADIALLLETAGIDRLVTVDLHCGQIQGFFRNVPVDNLFASTLFVSYIESKGLENIVVVSPDAGGVERAKKFSESLNKRGIETDMALISKERAQAGVVASMNLIGCVEGCCAIIIDDLCDTGGTLVKAAQLLKDNGASRVFAIVTHPVFSGQALEKIRNSVLEEMITSDTIPLRGEVPSNVHLISVAPLLGEAIRRIDQGESISVLFE
ncbi:MAG: ribose-phosphate pyrophosphokinase [Rhabdochlamydiaceae bacterium]|nr:ribose-phosphate pyrophosphokinase [Rhabdochlamydiaceae bacterium]